jgi:hypothetical protein
MLKNIVKFWVQGLGQWFPKWAVPPLGGQWNYLWGTLGAKGTTEGPLQVHCSLIYDRSDFGLETGDLVSLHQAHPPH